MATLKRAVRTARPITQTLRLKRAFVMLGFLLCATVLLCLSPSQARRETPDVYAIKDAQIVTGTGKTIAKGTVVVRDGLIKEVGENVRIPADARIIDGTGDRKSVV